MTLIEPSSSRRTSVRRTSIRLIPVLAVAAALAACSSGPARKTIDGHPPIQGGYKIGVPYQINGIWYYPKEDFTYDKEGLASWYGHPFHGRKTASGEVYDMWAMTAAHKTLPMPSLVEVTNLENGRKLRLRINDRGPFVSKRIIDLSRGAARELGAEKGGVVRVRVRVLTEESRYVAELAKARRTQEATAFARRILTGGNGVPRETAPVAVAEKTPESGPIQSNARNGTTPQPLVGTPTQSGTTQPVSSQPARTRAPKPTLASRGSGKRSWLKSEDLKPKAGIKSGNSPVSGTTPKSLEPSSRQAVPRVREAARPPVSTGSRRAAAPTTRASATMASGRYYVQAGSFRTMERARRLRTQLASVGPVRIVPAIVRGTQYYRVQVGPAATGEQGSRLLDRVQQAGVSNARVVRDR